MATLFPLPNVTEEAQMGMLPDSALRTSKNFRKGTFEHSFNGCVGSLRQRK